MSEQTECWMIRPAVWPEMISFDVTTRCNLRCVHCYNDSGSGICDDMPQAAILDTARQIVRLRPFNVCLCGGEPLCCPCLTEVIDALRPGVGKISMVCNGWALNKEKAQELADHGLDAVQISLDGAFAWQHDSLRGLAGSFERAVDAIVLSKQAGIKQVFVSLVPNKLNKDTMPEYVQLCEELGVDIIRTMPFLPSGRGRTIGRRLMLNEQEYFYFCRQLRQLRDFYGYKPLIEWSDPLSHLRLMQENAGRGERSIDMEIRANGDLAVSAYLPIIVGNCRNHSLSDYWNAGYDRIWSNPKLTAYTKPIRTIADLERFRPLPYSGSILLFEFLEDKL